MLTFGLIRDKKKDFMGNLKKRLQNLNNAGFEVGVFEGDHPTANMTNASLMSLMETGSTEKNIPPRKALDFEFRLWNKLENNKELRTKLKQYFSSINKTAPTLSVSMMMNDFGNSYSQSVKNNFGDLSKLVSNAPATISRKGFNSPLIEGGHLRASIDYRVVI